MASSLKSLDLAELLATDLPVDAPPPPPIPDAILRRQGERMFGGVVALEQIVLALKERAQDYGVKAKLQPNRAREFYVRAAELAEVCAAIEGRIGAMGVEVGRLVKARPELFAERKAGPEVVSA